MIEINKEYDVIINDNDNNGKGITRIDNFVVFVFHALKGESVRIKITNLNKKYAIGKIIKIYNELESRCTPLCKYYTKCGACTFLHTKYLNEKEIKTNYIKRLFNVELDNTVFNTEYNYRNKSTFHVKNNKIGYYSENTNDLVSFDYCYLLDERINKIYNYLKDLDLSKVSTITVRVTNDEIMVISDGIFDYKDLLSKHKIDSLYINDKLVYGSKYITYSLNDTKYTIFPKSFFQVNYDSMTSLYDIIKEYASGGNKLLDLYCGTGTIGIYLKDKYKSITGIEINESSILNANINKRINNINNINFILGDSKIAKNDNYDTIIVDPARNGLSSEVVKFLNESKSEIIYVSCNPSTLKRDIQLLNNYEIVKISIVNMFPKTKHIECVILLHTKK